MEDSKQTVLGNSKKRKFIELNLDSDPDSDVEYNLIKTKIAEDFVYGSKGRHSRARVKATCSSNISDNCKNRVIVSYESAMNTCDNHNRVYVCAICCRHKELRYEHRKSWEKFDVEDFIMGKYKSNSNIKVRAYCHFNISKNCYKQRVGQYLHIARTAKNNNGLYKCHNCIIYDKNKRENNSATKYIFDVNILEDIDSEFKAYLLGWIGSDGNLSGTAIRISIQKDDRKLLEQLRDGICKEIPVKDVKDNMVYLGIHSKKMNEDACKWLGLSFTDGKSCKKDSIIQFPNLKTDELKYHFLRGYFDGDGCIEKKKPKISVASSSKELLTSIKNFINLPCTFAGGQLVWGSTASLIVKERLYGNASIYLHRKYDKYIEQRSWRPKRKTEKIRKLLEIYEKLINK